MTVMITGVAARTFPQGDCGTSAFSASGILRAMVFVRDYLAVALVEGAAPVADGAFVPEL